MPKRLPVHPHILRWVREQLGLTQSDLAKMIGASQPTIQSIELGRLALSERFAYRLAQQLGVSAKWLLSNDWKSLPKPEELKRNFEQRWRFGFDQTYPDLLVLRLQILRDYILLRAVIDELGYHGCNATGFHTIWRKAVLDLLGTISDKRLRERIYQRFIDESGDALAVLKLVTNDCRDIRLMLTEHDRRKAEEREASPLRNPDAIILRWNPKKRIVQHLEKETKKPLPDNEVLKAGFTYRTISPPTSPPAEWPKKFLPLWESSWPAIIYYDSEGKLVSAVSVRA